MGVWRIAPAPNKVEKILMPESKRKQGIQRIDNTRGYLALPFDAQQFKDFLIGLLGKPQKIEKVIDGNFEVSLADAQNFHHLLAQRINQQNDAKLLQFRAKISFDDKSSVELNSFEELETYNEVRPIVSTDLVLSWDYLVLFNDKKQPEKQTIEIGIYTGGRRRASKSTSVLLDQEYFVVGTGVFRITILHTARTWAADIEAMLTNHIESLLKSPDKSREFLDNHQTIIGFGAAIIFYAIAIYGGFGATKSYLDQVALMARNTIMGQADVGAKINTLASFVLQGSVAEHYLELFFFLTLSLFLAILLGIWVASNIVSPNHSFILLIRKAVEERESLG